MATNVLHQWSTLKATSLKIRLARPGSFKKGDRHPSPGALKKDGKQKERAASFVTQESAIVFWKRTVSFDSVLSSTCEHDCIIFKLSPSTDTDGMANPAFP